LVFFFQAEDGIRDATVTGVQTCALPISIEFFSDSEEHLQILESQLKHIRDVDVYLIEPKDSTAPALVAIGITKGGERAAKAAHRSEERRVGKERRRKGTADGEKTSKRK